MFSGIIQTVGEIQTCTKSGSDEGLRLSIKVKPEFSNFYIGESICVNGVCLTVTEFNSNFFTVEVCNETLLKSNFNDIKVNDPVNLEKSLKLNDGISGHLVSGHVDFVGRVTCIEPDGFSIRMGFLAHSDINKYLVPKGSIAINGISLTLVNVEPRGDEIYFDVALIPHTLENTNLGKVKITDTVNLETDLIARHLAKIASAYLENLAKLQSV